MIELRALRIENEAKIQFQEERIKHMTGDLEIKLKQIRDYESKITSLNETIENKDYRIKD